MNSKYLRYLIAGIILVALVSVWFGTRKTIAIVVDGSPRSLTTSALTVGAALRSAGVVVGAEDQVFPPADDWLADGQVIAVNHASRVQIFADQEIHTLLTPERLPVNLLASAGILFDPGDLILVMGQAIAPDEPLLHAPVYGLQVRRAQQVTLLEGDDRKVFSSSASTLGEALWEAGIIIYEADQLTPPSSTPLTGPVEAVLARALPIQIVVDGQTVASRSTAQTVGSALAQAGIPLQGLDYSKPSEDSPLPEDGRIRVVRVSEDVVIEQEPVAFETQTQPLPELDIDNQQVVQVGEFGLMASRVRVRYEDGQEISRQVESEWVVREPKPRILGYGTNITIRTLDTPDGPVEYWRELTFYATSYSPSRAGVSPDSPGFGHVACGGLMQNGHVGVDLAYIPCWTDLYVPGYGYAVAADTGAISGAWIDLGYLDDDFVLWHQNVTVYFLTPVPPEDQIAWIIPEGTLK
jgi:uncharacterized protein YabE (DUF348 family)